VSIEEIINLLRSRGIQLDKFTIYNIEDFDDHYKVSLDGVIEIKKAGDRLERIFERQRMFSKEFINPETTSEDDKISYVKEMLLHILSEGDELLKATGKWKKFRFISDETKISGIEEEAIDIFKFVLNILYAYNRLNADSFEETFNRKSLVVEERFKWEKKLQTLTPNDKVCALDLDGVLAKYPENWINFLNQKRGLTAPIPIRLEDFQFISAPLPEIPRRKYYEWKHEFREQGFESLYVDPMEEASEFTKKVKDLGYNIIILSARPYKEYKRIMPDTIEWLRKHNILYDAVYWDSEKHVRILRDVPFLTFIVEDNPNIANEVASLGYSVYLLSRPYNKDSYISENIVRINNLLEIISHLQEAS